MQRLQQLARWRATLVQAPPQSPHVAAPAAIRKHSCASAVRHWAAQVHGLRLEEAQGDSPLLTFDQQAAVFVSGAPAPRAQDQPAGTVPAVGGALALGYICRVRPAGMHAHESMAVLFCSSLP